MSLTRLDTYTETDGRIMIIDEWEVHLFGLCWIDIPDKVERESSKEKRGEERRGEERSQLSS
jgi:hypothetical protein